MEESSESPSAQHVTRIILHGLALHWPHWGLHWMDFYCSHGIFYHGSFNGTQIESRRIIVLIMLGLPFTATWHSLFTSSMNPSFVQTLLQLCMQTFQA